MIDFRTHSSRHLETKLMLPIPERRSYERELHYYLFSPPQLHVDRQTYSERDILNKFQCHGRYSSFEITMEELLDDRNAISPLTMLRGYVDRLERHADAVAQRSVIHELQTIVNSVRHENKAIIQDCRDMAKLGMLEDLGRTLAEWLEHAKALDAVIRTLTGRIGRALRAGSRIHLAFLWADEALSIINEKGAIDLYMTCSNMEAEMGPVLATLLSYSREHGSYRSNRRYASGSDDTETVQYRKAVLKKWTQSALYLIPVVSKWPMRMSQILAGTAAAIAMTFATLASIFAENTYIKNSLQWALIVIIAYVFKDRIKEWLRAFFNTVLPKMMADEISSFLSPKTGTKICSSRIKLNFLDMDKVPRRVREIRRDRANPFADMLPDDHVIHYVRNLIMHPQDRKRKDGKRYYRENRFTLVTRIRIDDFLKEMDDPSDVVFRMDPNADELDQLVGDRVYHLHLVIREYAKREHIDRYTHHVVVLNKEGIVRVEQMPVD